MASREAASKATESGDGAPVTRAEFDALTERLDALYAWAQNGLLWPGERR